MLSGAMAEVKIGEATVAYSGRQPSAVVAYLGDVRSDVCETERAARLQLAGRLGTLRTMLERNR